MILATRAGRDAEYRAWAGANMPSRSSLGFSAGVSVTPTSAGGVPAITAAVNRAANEVARLSLGVWRGRRPDWQRIETTWQARFFRGAPNPQQTRFGFWHTVEESLSYRNNSFIWKIPGEGRITSWWALHPDQVMAYWTRDKAGIAYDVTVGAGFVDPIGQGPKTYRVTGDMLHIRGSGDGGMLMAPSPIERHADVIGSAIARQRHESNLYARGVSSRLAVEFPREMTFEQASQWRELFADTYEGTDNAGKTIALGGGGILKPISLSQRDAQYVETVGMSVEEVARIFNVPVSLIDGQHGNDPLSPEHELQRWIRYGLEPRLYRIECALAEDADFFGPGSRDYPRFETDGLLRGDLATEDAIAHEQIQDGRILVDEWRKSQGLPPLPGGVGMIPQVVPVGGAPNPAGASPSPADDPGGAA